MHGRTIKMNALHLVVMRRHPMSRTFHVIHNHCPEEKEMLALKLITSGTNFESISVFGRGKWLGC
jgi:hypothetical protein